MPTNSRRGDLPPAAASFGTYIDSHGLVMRVNGRAPKTIRGYADATSWFAQWLTGHTGIRRWDQVTRAELRQFFLYMADCGYAQNYLSNTGRALQQFFKWFAEEEELPDPFTRFKPPPPSKLGGGLVPVLELDDMRRLIKDAEAGRDFESRRDAALLRLFACTGCRLAEVTNLQLADVDVRDRTAVVTGKGSKRRQVKFDHKCALALDRYLRKRSEHAAAGLSALWIGVRRRVGMTRSGIYQVIERRGERLGLDIHPHMFRHTFSHNWLDAGGAEGDLMELNGWDSPQMLRHYGASARSARARRAYDRINPMGDL